MEVLGYDGTLKFDTSIDTSGFQRGVDNISKAAGKAMKVTTEIIATAVTAVTGIGTAAVKVGTDFESAMSNVAAISGATGKDLDALTEKAKEMGAKTKFSATESADAFSYMAMAGWKTKDMLDGIEGIMNLAAASGEDLASTSDIVTDALTAFGLQASDSGRFADILAAASSNANTNVGLMGETFKYVAPVAGALGFSAEDCATAIGLMANAGIKGSQAGTSLRSVISRMTKPTDEVAGAMDKLGVSLTDSEGNMKSLNEIMLDLRDGFSGLSESEKAQMAAALGGQEAMSGLLAIVNASDDDFHKLSKAIYGCDGAAKNMAETMNDNLAGQFTILKSGLEGLGLALYEEMEAPLKDIVKAAQEMVAGLTESFNDGGLDGMVDKAGEILAEIIQGLSEAAPQFIGVGVDLIHAFLDGIVNNADTFAAAGAELISSLASAILSVSGELWGVGIEIFRKLLEGLAGNAEEIGRSGAKMVNDISRAVIENLPLIVQAGRDIIQGFCDGMMEEGDGIAALFAGFIEGFSDTAGTIIQELADVVTDLFRAINEADPARMESIGKAIGSVVAAIAALKVAQSVVGGVKSLFSVLGSLKKGILGITGVIGRVVEGFALWTGGAGTLSEVIALQFPRLAGLIGTVGNAFSAVINFFSTFGQTIAGVGSIIGGAILAVTNFVDMFINGFNAVKELLMVVGVALAAVGAVILGAPAAIAAAVAGVIAAAATLVVVIKDNWTAIVEFFKGIPAKIGEVVDSVIEWFSQIPEKSGEILDLVVDFFTGLPDRIVQAVSSLIEKFTAWGESVLETASAVAQQIVDSVVQFFSELPYKIGYAIGFVIGTLAKWASDIGNWIATNVPVFIENIVTFFSQLPGKIWDWLVNAFTKICDWGKGILEWIDITVPQMIANIVKFFSELPDKIWSHCSQAFDRFTTWAGQMLDKAKQAGSDVLQAIVDFFSQLPGEVETWLTDTIQKAEGWVTDMAAKGREAASQLVEEVIDGVKDLPSQMMSIGSEIVNGVWEGIQNAASSFMDNVQSFFAGIVDGAKAALGISSPSKVFAEEVGEWVPPGVGQGIERSMPALLKSADAEMEKLASRMRSTVSLETAKIELDKNITHSYQAEKDNGQSFDDRKTEVVISGDTHIHVDLDGEEIGNATTPTIDRNLARIDAHKKRGG